MSYARWSPDSDVYVFGSVYGGYECLACFATPDLSVLYTHLLDHRAKGDKVPDYTLDKITEELHP